MACPGTPSSNPGSKGLLPSSSPPFRWADEYIGARWIYSCQASIGRKIVAGGVSSRYNAGNGTVRRRIVVEGHHSTEAARPLPERHLDGGGEFSERPLVGHDLSLHPDFFDVGSGGFSDFCRACGVSCRCHGQHPENRIRLDFG